MTAQNYEIQVIDRSTNKVTFIQSQEILLKLKALGIDGLEITKEPSGELRLSGKLKTADGVAADDVSTKGQLDVVDAVVQQNVSDILNNSNNISTNAGNILTNSNNIATNTGNILTNTNNISTNTTNIAQNASDISDNDDDITDLQNDLGQILSNEAAEEIKVSPGPGGATIFTLTSLTVDPDNTVRDVEVFVDGVRQGIAVDGVFNASYKQFRKNSATEIEFANTVAAGAAIHIWKQGTSVISAGALTAINVDIQPSVSGGQSVGTITKPWASLFLKDKTTAQVWELEVDNGTFSVTQVAP